jgi:hypothetical protein
MGDVVTQIYPVRSQPGTSKQASLVKIEGRLDQWYITLPAELRYDVTSKRCTPPPTILFLHIRYWGTVLLLHRALSVLLVPSNEQQC